MLSGYSPGNYVLYSPIQKENGPRLFQPMFGFYYSGLNTNIQVTVLPTDSASFLLTPSGGIAASNNAWSYFSRNLSSIAYFTSAWNSSREWQVGKTT